MPVMVTVRETAVPTWLGGLPDLAMLIIAAACVASCAMHSGKQGEKLMPVGMFRGEEGWVQVD